MAQTEQPTARPVRPLTIALLAGLVIVYAWTIGGLALTRYRLYISSWDLSIFHQAVWLLAHGEFNPYLTVRGMGLWEHHLSLWLWPMALLYRLAPPLASTLVVAAVAAVCLGGVVLFAIARRETGSEAAALVWTAVYFAYPAQQFMTLHDVHGEPFAVPLWLGAIWFAGARRWLPMAVCLGLAMLVKEDCGLVVACFGLGLMLSGERRRGAVAVIVGLAYTLLALKVIMPAFSPGDGKAFYTDQFFGHLGDSAWQVALSPLLRPRVTAEALFTPVNAALLASLLVPVAGLCLLKPSWLVGGAATLYLNMVGGFWPTHTVEYHYQGFVLPFILAAAVGGSAWLAERLAERGARPAVAVATGPVLAVLGLLLGPALWPGLVRAPAAWPWHRPPIEAAWTANRTWAPTADAMVARIPPDDSVASNMLLLDKLSGRRQAWLFANPFVTLTQETGDPEAVTTEAVAAGLAARPVDWLLLGEAPGNVTPLSERTYPLALAAVEQSPWYELVEATEGLRLYRRRSDRPTDPAL